MGVIMYQNRTSMYQKRTFLNAEIVGIPDFTHII
jgi:hypothetical protein